MSDEAQERERFEAWAAGEVYQLYRNRDLYTANDTWHAWQGWLAAKRDAARDAEQWRDIESAPKDGTPILVYEDGETPAVASWRVTYDDYQQPKPINWYNVEDGYRYTPTHWRALPPPPTAAQSEGGEE